MAAARRGTAPAIYAGDLGASAVHGPAAGRTGAVSCSVSGGRGPAPAPAAPELQAIGSLVPALPCSAPSGDRDRSARPLSPGLVGHHPRVFHGGIPRTDPDRHRTPRHAPFGRDDPGCDPRRLPPDEDQEPFREPVRGGGVPCDQRRPDDRVRALEEACGTTRCGDRFVASRARGALRPGGTHQLSRRGHRPRLPGARLPTWHLALRRHHRRRFAGGQPPPQGGTLLLPARDAPAPRRGGRKSTPFNSPHHIISYPLLSLSNKIILYPLQSA